MTDTAAAITALLEQHTADLRAEVEKWQRAAQKATERAVRAEDTLAAVRSVLGVDDEPTMTHEEYEAAIEAMSGVHPISRGPMPTWPQGAYAFTAPENGEASAPAEDPSGGEPASPPEPPPEAPTVREIIDRQGVLDAERVEQIRGWVERESIGTIVGHIDHIDDPAERLAACYVALDVETGDGDEGRSTLIRRLRERIEKLEAAPPPPSPEPEPGRRPLLANQRQRIAISRNLGLVTDDGQADYLAFCEERSTPPEPDRMTFRQAAEVLRWMGEPDDVAEGRPETVDA